MNADLIYRSDVIQLLDCICDYCKGELMERLDQLHAKQNALFPRSRAVLMAYTGVAMLRGEKLGHFYEYLAELYGRPIFSHELPYLDDLADRAKTVMMCFMHPAAMCR